MLAPMTRRPCWYCLPVLLLARPALSSSSLRSGGSYVRFRGATEQTSSFETHRCAMLLRTRLMLDLRPAQSVAAVCRVMPCGYAWVDVTYRLMEDRQKPGALGMARKYR